MPGIRCCVPLCKNFFIERKTNQKKKDISFHRFPKNDKIRQQWVKRCERDKNRKLAYSFVCSEHFTSESFERDLRGELLGIPSRKRLKPTALPTLRLRIKMDLEEEQQNEPGSTQQNNLTMSRPNLFSENTTIIKEENKSFPVDNCATSEENYLEKLEGRTELKLKEEDNVLAENSNFTIKEEIIEDVQDDEMEVQAEKSDDEIDKELEDDGFDFCRVEVKIEEPEDSEVHLQPEFVAVNNKDYTSFPEIDAEEAMLLYTINCKNPYSLFSKEEWHRVKADYPAFNFKDITREVSRRWTELDQAGKDEYKTRIEEAKARYEAAAAQYVAAAGFFEAPTLSYQQPIPDAEERAKLFSIIECKQPRILFYKEEWQKVKAAYPDYDPQGISSEVGRRWTQLDNETKDEYWYRIEEARARYEAAAGGNCTEVATNYKVPKTSPPVQAKPDRGNEADIVSIVKSKHPRVLFYKEEWPKVKAMHPDYGFKEISQEVSRRWTELDEASKNEYKTRIEAARAKYSPMMAKKDAELRFLNSCKHPYIMFSREEWHKVKAEHPEFEFKDISKEVSKRWGELDEAKKEEYKFRIRAAQARYNQVCEEQNTSVWVKEEPLDLSFHSPEREQEVQAKQDQTLLTPTAMELQFQKKTPYSCEQCEQQFSNKKKMFKHVTEAHPKPRPTKKKKTYTCHECEQTFLKKTYLREHIQLEHPQPGKEAKSYSCEQCNHEPFPLKKLLEYHIRLTHPKESFRCSQCNRICFTKRKLLIHEISHMDGKPELVSVRDRLIPKTYECEACLKHFKTKKQLALHDLRHKFPQVSHTCEHCDRTFKSKGKLARHQIASHSVQPVACKHCGKKYVKKIFLDRHYRLIHSEEVN